MTKEQIKELVEGLIESLIEESGQGTEREEVVELALINVIYGYYKDKYTKEDIIMLLNI